MLFRLRREDFLLHFSTNEELAYFRAYLFNGRTSKNFFNCVQMCNFCERASFSNNGLARQPAVMPNVFLSFYFIFFSVLCIVKFRSPGWIFNLIHIAALTQRNIQFWLSPLRQVLFSFFFGPGVLRPISPPAWRTRLTFLPLSQPRRYFISQNYCGLDDIRDRRNAPVSPLCWLVQCLQ